MGRTILLTVLLAFAAAAARPAIAADCLPRSVAPAELPNPAGGGDAGVLADGFLDLRDEHGVFQIAHGVDLSDHNAPDYDKLKACGAEFAMIKIYPYNPTLNTEQIKALTARNITVIPYYYLVMSSKYKYFPEKFATDDDLEAEIAEAQSIGQADAEEFLQSYDRYFGADHKVTVGGLSGNLIALDVEEAFQTTTPAALKARGPHAPRLKESHITAGEFDRYGQTYSAMLVAWVKTVQAAHPDAVVIFYTYPNMYLTYLLSARDDDFAVIRSLPVWIAEYTTHGGDLTDTGSTTLKGAQRLCLSASGGNKCVVQQYTGRGLFGQVQPAGGGPLHLDLNRFFMVDAVPDGTSIQFVRKIIYVNGVATDAPAPGSSLPHAASPPPTATATPAPASTAVSAPAGPPPANAPTPPPAPAPIPTNEPPPAPAPVPVPVPTDDPPPAPAPIPPASTASDASTPPPAPTPPAPPASAPGA